MRKLSLTGLLSAAFMFPQIPLSVDYSLDFLNVLTLLNHPVSNQVQDLFVLVCKVLESDHRIRLPRAPHDSAQNEAERTNAAIGEALATGKPVEPPIDPFHGLTAEQMDNMT